MSSKILNPSTFEEKLIWYGMILTYPLFAIGGLYVTGSIVGWLILITAMIRWYVSGKDEFFAVPNIVWLWSVTGFIMLLALFIAHSNWQLGVVQTIKSSIGWAKGWALIPLFLLLGAVIKINTSLIVRAVCIVSFHSLIFSVITLCIYITGINGDLFISPLKIIGGPGPDFFKVSLYGLNPETNLGRWRFFAPWAPAAGFMACIFFIFCSLEKNTFWRRWGIMGSVVMCLLSQSRAGWVIFIMLIALPFSSGKFSNPFVMIAFGILMPAILIFGEPVFEFFQTTYMDVKAARPESTRVRSALETLALQRWESEAPIWGHGIVERGPKIVEGMPIGSHHSWYGLLFVKGIVGLLALAVPLLVTSVYLFWQSHSSKVARSAWHMMVVIICYSFFENLEILAYIIWPALLWIGIALNPLKLGEKNV
jgi:hypothetical protein